jgi:hypothetical protein
MARAHSFSSRFRLFRFAFAGKRFPLVGIMTAFLMRLFVCGTLLFLTACATRERTPNSPRADSPTTALIRGEITADEYLSAIREANEKDRANEAFELNKEPTRAYNTKTNKVEYVPEGTDQYWNEQTQRWEFTPID